MRFMVLVKANADSEAGRLPTTEQLAAMGRFNEEMAAAGVLVGGEGLQASAKGAKIRFSGDERTVVHGPFPYDGDRLVAGFWIIKVASLDEAVAWMKRCPNPSGGGETELEIRQVFEMEDFGEAMTPELVEQEARLRAAGASA
jgi:hypothetical protein